MNHPAKQELFVPSSVYVNKRRKLGNCGWFLWERRTGQTALSGFAEYDEGSSGIGCAGFAGVQSQVPPLAWVTRKAVPCSGRAYSGESCWHCRSGRFFRWPAVRVSRDYVHNGFKVGPNYCPPPAPVAKHWIDQADIHVAEGQDLSRWWTVFHDPTLDRLILCAYRQNLTLREAGFRILQARALLGIAKGEIFPQTQNATGSYQRIAQSQNTAQGPLAVPFFDQWNFGFNLAWELDFWGRLRRAIAAADDQLDASVADYDQVLVTLLGDVASNYVQIRTDQERLRYLRQNVTILELVLKWTERREKVGFKTTPLDVHQTESNLEQTVSGIPQLEMDLRTAENRLCVLMGMPPADLRNMLGEDLIPTAPPELAIGIPAELLRRRPDVRRAERQAAAQSEAIGIAEADLYPAFSISGTLGWQAKNFSDLFSGKSLDEQHRPVVPVEPPQLRADRQQRPLPGRQVPGIGGDLPADRAPGGRGGGGRAGDVPPGPATGRGTWTRAWPPPAPRSRTCSCPPRWGSPASISTASP